MAAKVLTEAGATAEKIEQQIEKLVGFGAPDPSAPQGLTPRTKRIVELAVAAASQLAIATSAPSTFCTACCTRVRMSQSPS